MGKLSLKNCAIMLCLAVASFAVLPMLYSIKNPWYQGELMFLVGAILFLCYYNIKIWNSNDKTKKQLKLNVVFAAIIIAAIIDIELSALAFIIPDVLIRNITLALIFVSALLTMPLTAKKLNY